MKILFVLLLAAIVINLSISEDVYSANDLEEWNNFKTTHGRNYDQAEDSRRIKIYIDNKNRITAHNARYDKGEVSYKMGINEFADRFPEELPRGGLRV